MTALPLYATAVALGALVCAHETASAISLSCSGGKIDVILGGEAETIATTSDNVNKVIEQLTSKGFQYRTMTGCLPVGPGKGATVVELIKGEERYLVVQRLYDGMTSLIRVTAPGAALTLRGM